MKFNGEVAVTGFSEMAPQKSPAGWTPLSIMQKVAIDAIKDAGLEKSEIDGLIAGSSIASPSWYWSLAVAEYIGLDLKY